MRRYGKISANGREGAQQVKFEENLKKLETIVDGMESGQMNLDAMIKAFEDGRKLVTQCRKDLESVQLRIEKVTKGGEIAELEI